MAALLSLLYLRHQKLRNATATHLAHLERKAVLREFIAKLRNAIEFVHKPAGHGFVIVAHLHGEASLGRFVCGTRTLHAPRTRAKRFDVSIFEVGFVDAFADDLLDDVFDGN